MPRQPQSKPTKGAPELVVGQGIRLKATIDHCDALTVRGWLESSLRSRRVEVARGGVLMGEIDADEAVIDGRVDGSLTVRKRLVLRPHGEVRGTVRYARIEIADGGTIAGDFGPLADKPD